MKNLNGIEFYVTPAGEIMISPESEAPKLYEMEDREFTEQFLEIITNRHPKAVAALGKLYLPSKLNRTYYEYRIVHRFIRCNFPCYDDKKDIDNRGAFNFEFVQCPLKGECTLCNVVCNPEFDTQLTGRERDVMRQYFNGLKSDEIAEKLGISLHTLLKHKCNALAKFKMHSLTEFISYASKTNMFQNEEI